MRGVHTVDAGCLFGFTVPQSMTCNTTAYPGLASLPPTHPPTHGCIHGIIHPHTLLPRPRAALSIAPPMASRQVLVFSTTSFRSIPSCSCSFLRAFSSSATGSRMALVSSLLRPGVGKQHCVVLHAPGPTAHHHMPSHTSCTDTVTTAFERSCPLNDKPCSSNTYAAPPAQPV